MNDYESQTLCILKVTEREIKQRLNAWELI